MQTPILMQLVAISRQSLRATKWYASFQSASCLLLLVNFSLQHFKVQVRVLQAFVFAFTKIPHYVARLTLYLLILFSDFASRCYHPYSPLSLPAGIYSHKPVYRITTKFITSLVRRYRLGRTSQNIALHLHFPSAQQISFLHSYIQLLTKLQIAAACLGQYTRVILLRAKITKRKSNN